MSESVLVKTPTKIRISAMFCALCARVCRCMVAYTVAKNSHGKKNKIEKVKPCLIVSLIMVPLNSLFIHHKTAKCGHYQKKKKVNETVARLRSETGIITANLHKVAEDL